MKESWGNNVKFRTKLNLAVLKMGSALGGVIQCDEESPPLILLDSTHPSGTCYTQWHLRYGSAVNFVMEYVPLESFPNISYNYPMHKIQQQILDLARRMNIGQFTLREIGARIGQTSPQKIKHHLNQLEKRGLIKVDRLHRRVVPTRPGQVSGLLSRGRLLSIPIIGAANAGPATLLADENIEGYLRISSTFIRQRSVSNLFALRVAGSSMNRASIEGKTIQDGDYVLVDRDARSPRDGDIVVSIIDGMANIKRLHHDKSHEQIVLLSESTQDIPPIYIHEDDDFMINGTVQQVIKKPAF